MKKILSALLILVMVLALVSCASQKPDSDASTPAAASSVSGENNSPDNSPKSESKESEPPVDNKDYVYVTIVDQTGKLALAQEKIELKDADGDGKLTIDDAFVCTHETAFSGGKAGYVTGETQYGVSIFKLWGSDDGKSFMYYLNNQMAMGLSDEVKNGDYLDAFVFCDTEFYSDAYSYFDQRSIVIPKGQSLTLILYKTGFDDNFSPISLPADEGVAILVNGEQTDAKTDAEGKLTLTFTETGVYTVSASSAGMPGLTLVPPVCIVTVE